MLFWQLPLKFFITQQPAEAVFIALEAIYNIACKAENFLDIAILLGTALYDLARLEATVVEEVGPALLALVAEKPSDHFPALGGMIGIFRDWFFGETWLGPGYLVGTQLGA